MTAGHRSKEPEVGALGALLRMPKAKEDRGVEDYTGVCSSAQWLPTLPKVVPPV